MPNWCSNSLEITGPVEAVKNLEAFVGRPLTEGEQTIQEPIFSLANIKPSTPDIDPKHALFPSKGEDDWWHNNVNSWGTKWDVYGEGVGKSSGDGYVNYSFDSAWSPPTPVIERLAQIFPEVSIKFSYYETGCDFWGIENYANGELVSEVGGEMSHKAYETLGMDCWNCEMYDEDPEENGEYLYDDCPEKEAWDKRQAEAEQEASV